MADASGGNIDWSQYGGKGGTGGRPLPRSATSATSATSAPTPTGGGNIDWSQYGGVGSSNAPSAQQASTVPGASHGGGGLGGFLGKIVHGIVSAPGALGEGLLQLGKDVGVTGFHAGENVVNDVAGTHLGPQSGWRDHGGLVASQQEITDTLNQRPALRGAVEGFKQTGNEIAHPSRIPQNYGRNPVGSLLNDAANLSLVLGPVAGATEGLGGVGGAIGKAADATHAVATAPLAPLRVGFGRLVEVPAVAEKLDQMKANRQVRDFAAENYKQPARQAVGDVAKAFVPAGKLSADEQAALVMTQRNELGLLRPVLDKMSPEQRATFFDQHFGGPDSPVTPAAANIAYEHGAGTLPADQAARLDEALGSVRANVTEPRQAAALSGAGMAGDSRLSPEQTGFAPLGDATGESIKDWPARLRPMGIAATDAIKTLRGMGGDHAALADEIRPTLDAIRAAGIDAEHVIGGTDKAGGRGGNVRMPGGPPSEKPTGAQLQRLGNSTEYNAHGQAGMEAKRAVQGVRNVFAQKVADPASGFVVPSSAVTDDPVLSGRDLYQAAQMHPDHLVPYDPAKAQPLFPKGEGNVAPENVTRDTLFMPKNLYDAFAKQERAIPDYNSAGSRFDRLSTVVRKNPLLLSPTYHVRIATSNAMLAGLQGDLTANPIELARRILEAKRLLSTGEAPRALIRNGMFADEQALMDQRRAGDSGAVGKAFHGPVAVGQKVSATIDNFSRVMSYIGEKAKGYSDEEAVRRANDVIGQYEMSTPFEQNVMRRVLPIYPWLKQVATVAARLGQDHPVATTFALHMGNLAAQQDDATGRPAWMRGWLPVGGNKFLPTDLANPFGVLASPPGGFTSPLIKAPLAALTGLNASTMQQYSRPPGQPTHGALWHNPAELQYVLSGFNPLTRTLRDMRLRPVQRFGTGEPIVSAANGYREVASQRPSPLATLAGIPMPQAGPTAAAQAKTAKTATSNARAAQRYSQRVKNADRLPPVKHR